jgi:hypothetical protein
MQSVRVGFLQSVETNLLESVVGLLSACGHRKGEKKMILRLLVAIGVASATAMAAANQPDTNRSIAPSVSREAVERMAGSITGDVIIVDWHGTWDYTTIQAALWAASSGDTIIVLPSDGSPAGAYLENLYFPARSVTLRSIAPEDPDVVNRTVIDGNTDGTAITFGYGATRDSVIDGFTITGGRQIGDPDFRSGGGGMLLEYASPTIRHCAFVRNEAVSGGGLFGGGGGAIFIRYGSSPSIEKCMFLENAALFIYNYSGGAIYIEGDCSLDIEDSTFAGNYAVRGGAISIVSAPTVTMTNTVFVGNRATDNDLDGVGGAVLMLQDSFVTLTNCTLVGNYAEAFGGGLDVGIATGNPPGALTVTNSVFWENVRSVGVDENAQFRVIPSTQLIPDVNYTTIQGWTGQYGGVENNGDDPYLIDPDGLDNVPGTIDDDVRPAPPSAAIDAGNNNADVDVSSAGIQPLPDYDRAGLARFVDDPGTADTGAGDPPIVDRGAYEYQVDCDGNGTPDADDIAGGAPDCNSNGIPDTCDFAAGIALDCNGNGVPDGCDALSGFSDDCNGDFIPDLCELAGNDCNTNLIPDECDAAAIVTTAPDGAQICADGMVQFSVLVRDPQSTTYQWLKDGSPINDRSNVSGANTDTLTISDLAASDSGSYSCRVWETCVEAESAPAVLTVLLPATITADPTASLTRCEGDDASFTVAASGTAPITYDWRKDGESLGAPSTPSLFLGAVTPDEVGSYSCVVSNQCGSDESAAGVLNVQPLPKFTSQPETTCGEVGETVVLTVSVEAPVTFFIQWRKGSTTVGTGETLTLDNLISGDAGEYRAVAFTLNPTCLNYSDPATVQVGGCPVCGTPGDMDADGDYDLADMQQFVLCFGENAVTAPQCVCANVADLDWGIDDLDWTDLADLVTGPE